VGWELRVAGCVVGTGLGLSSTGYRVAGLPGCGLRVAGYELRVTSCGLRCRDRTGPVLNRLPGCRVAGYELRVTSCGLRCRDRTGPVLNRLPGCRVAGLPGLGTGRVTSCGLRVAGCVVGTGLGLSSTGYRVAGLPGCRVAGYELRVASCGLRCRDRTGPSSTGYRVTGLPGCGLRVAL
jgi:hypothetical protein